MILVYCFLVLFSSYRLVHRKPGDPLHFFLAWSLTASGIHLALMIALGVWGFLRPVPLTLGAGALALFVLAVRPARPGALSLALVKDGLQFFRRDIGRILSGLVVLAVLWLLAAAVLIPPSTVDGLTYHLPPVYEFVLRGRIITMPADLVPAFAYPMNGDLLLSWPLIFIRDVSLTAIMGTCQAVFAALAVFALSRRLGLLPFGASISALAFFFMPVVLALSGSAYVDLIATAYTVMACFFLLHFRERREPGDLYLAGLALGILAGIKYSYLPVIGYLGIVLLVLARRSPWRGKAFAALLFVLTGGYWYFRNWLVYGDPLFPLQFLDRSFGVLHQGRGEALSSAGSLIAIGQNFWNMVSNDALGNDLYGGFGLAVHVLGWASAGFMLWRSLQRRRSIDQYIIFGLLPLAAMLLGLLSPKMLPYNARLVLFAMPVLCYSIGGALQLIEERGWRLARAAVLGVVILSAVVSLVSLSGLRLPTYNITYPLRDIAQGRYVSRMLYTCCSSHVLDPCIFWGLLDAMTLENAAPWRIRQHHDPQDVYWASLYGSRLQNRVDGLSEGEEGEPDAVIVMYASCKAGENCASRQRLADGYRRDPGYALVADTARSALFIRKVHLADPNVLGVLARVKDVWGQRYIERLIER